LPQAAAWYYICAQKLGRLNYIEAVVYANLHKPSWKIATTLLTGILENFPCK